MFARIRQEMHRVKCRTFLPTLKCPPPAAIARSRAASTITCMATPLRVARVSKQLRREIGELFVMDKVVLKYLHGMSDVGLDQCATITDVVVSGDLQVAKVYIALHGFNGDDTSSDWQRLCQLQPYIRKIIGRRVSLRRTPEIRFILDRDFEKMYRALDILEHRRLVEEAEELGLDPPPPLEDRSMLQPPSPDFLDNNQPDEDPIPSVETMFADMFESSDPKRERFG